MLESALLIIKHVGASFETFDRTKLVLFEFSHIYVRDVRKKVEGRVST